MTVSAMAQLFIATSIVGLTACKPSRSDCIAGVQLEWGDDQIDRAGVLRTIATLYPMQIDLPTAGLAIQEQQRIYVIFDDRCQDKIEMMSTLAARLKDGIEGFPEYSIIEETIQPSTDTIAVYGDAWSDGKFPDR